MCWYAMSGGVMSALPYFVSGKVLKVFSRGSKDLDIPTGKYLVRKELSDIMTQTN